VGPPARPAKRTAAFIVLSHPCKRPAGDGVDQDCQMQTLKPFPFCQDYSFALCADGKRDKVDRKKSQQGMEKFTQNVYKQLVCRQLSTLSSGAAAAVVTIGRWDHHKVPVPRTELQTATPNYRPTTDRAYRQQQ
jgi:hypothetical protein